MVRKAETTVSAVETTDATPGTRRTRTVPDPQVETTRGGDLYEVLVEYDPTGWRTVHRIQAADAAAAGKAIGDGLAEGARVVEVAVAGTGLGSGDAPRV